MTRALHDAAMAAKRFKMIDVADTIGTVSVYLTPKPYKREAWAKRQREAIQAAARTIGAVPADIPGLWFAPYYPELTTGQLLSIAYRKEPHNAD